MKKIKLLFIPLLLIMCILMTSCFASKGLSLSVGYKKLSMYVGESLYLDTNANDLGSGEVKWESSDPEVASVSSDGEIVALKKGYTYITATFDEDSAKVYLEVKEQETKRTLEITGKQMVIVNETIILQANIELDYSESVVWSSSDETIATIESDGTVSGVATGLVTITASLSSDPSITDSISILVRTGNGIQDVIINNIYNETYELNGDLDLTELSDKIVETVSKANPAVIGVSEYSQSGSSYSISGTGSGVIIDREDLGDGTYKYTFLTNCHVVEDAAKVRAYIGGDVDKEYDAVVLKQDESHDLAKCTFVYNVLIDPIQLSNTSDDVKVGEFVIAIGSPGGFSYYNSVTFGVASYVKRTMDDEASVFIQHDAAISPGNSGGALLNVDGKLIGINTMKIAKTAVEGMNFAIDIDTIKAFLNEN